MPIGKKSGKTSKSAKRQYEKLAEALTSVCGIPKSELPSLPPANPEALLVLRAMRATIKAINPELLAPAPPRAATPRQVLAVQQMVEALADQPGFVTPFKGDNLSFKDAHAFISRWGHLRPATPAQMESATRIAQNLGLPIPKEDGVHTCRSVGDFLKIYMSASIEAETRGQIVPLSGDELADLHSIQEDVRRGNPHEPSYADLQRQWMSEGFRES